VVPTGNLRMEASGKVIAIIGIKKRCKDMRLSGVKQFLAHQTYFLGGLPNNPFVNARIPAKPNPNAAKQQIPPVTNTGI